MEVRSLLSLEVPDCYTGMCEISEGGGDTCSLCKAFVAEQQIAARKTHGPHAMLYDFMLSLYSGARCPSLAVWFRDVCVSESHRVCPRIYSDVGTARMANPE